MMRILAQQTRRSGKGCYSLLPAALCALAFTAVLPAQSNITYNFKQTIGAGSVVGVLPKAICVDWQRYWNCAGVMGR